MALPNKEQYFPTKTIYILQAPLKYDRGGKLVQGWYQHGVTFNEHGRGSTTSYNDAQFLIKNCNCKDISKKHWERKAKEWAKLEKAEGKSKPEPKPEQEAETEDEVEPEKS